VRLVALPIREGNSEDRHTGHQEAGDSQDIEHTGRHREAAGRNSNHTLDPAHSGVADNCRPVAEAEDSRSSLSGKQSSLLLTSDQEEEEDILGLQVVLRTHPARRESMGASRQRYPLVEGEDDDTNEHGRLLHLVAGDTASLLRPHEGGGPDFWDRLPWFDDELPQAPGRGDRKSLIIVGAVRYGPSKSAAVGLLDGVQKTSDDSTSGPDRSYLVRLLMSEKKLRSNIRVVPTLRGTLSVA
jgi:hypothetical protein